MQLVLLMLFFLQPWPQPRPPALAQASATDEFAPLRRQWVADLREKKIDAALALYSSDATFVNPDGSRAHGTAPIRQLFQWAAETFDSALTFHPDRLAESGSLAVDSGTYQETLVVRATGEQQVLSGSYLMVYRREAGQWKILEQDWTSKQPE
jgi:ketosteroid isomerase-like protein